MVLAWEGAQARAVRTLYRCISAGAWDDDARLKRHGQEVDTSPGEDDNVRKRSGD